MAAKRDDELTRALGAPPPAAFKRLSASDRKHLADQIENAFERQIEAIDRAEDNIVQHLPRPLRGPVRKLLKAPERR